MTSEATPSPLSEVKEDSLNDLFMKDPLNLSEADIERVVTELRRKREQWQAAEASGAKRAPKAIAAPKVKPDVALDLDDLGL